MNAVRGITDEEQIKSINSIVHKNDTLIILGDIGDIECVKKLRAGYKVLVKGNHDRGATYYKDVFDEVYEGALIISSKIIISHEPIKHLPEFLFSIHGHDHSGYYDWDFEPRLNVCAELMKYKPISLKEIIEAGFLTDIPDMHRLTIDKQIAKKIAQKN